MTMTPRTDPPNSGDEITMLRSYVAFHRDTLRRKTEGLTAEQLSTTHPPSELTLGGLLKHLALVEHDWFTRIFLGGDYVEPWASVDWDADADWDFHSAVEDTPEQLRDLFDATVADSERIIEQALAGPDGLDTVAVHRPGDPDELPIDLRYILVHMVEEYSRHNGHADLIREAIDGSTGE